jgi:hypothetical protein
VVALMLVERIAYPADVRAIERFVRRRARGT